jgi:hypothetical protein
MKLETRNQKPEGMTRERFSESSASSLLVSGFWFLVSALLRPSDFKRIAA